MAENNHEAEANHVRALNSRAQNTQIAVEDRTSNAACINGAVASNFRSWLPFRYCCWADIYSTRIYIQPRIFKKQPKASPMRAITQTRTGGL